MNSLDSQKQALASPAAALPNMSTHLAALADRGELRRYRKGTLLIQEGDPGDTIYVVLAGKLKVFANGQNDREIIFGMCGPGDYVGEMSLDGGPRSASVITLEPSTCSVITRHTLRQHIADHPDFAFELLARVIRRARMATRDARNLALIDTYGRLVRLLEELAIDQPDGTRMIPERLTHRELSNRVGCSREMISRLMKDLEGGQYVSSDARGMRLRGLLPSRW